MILLTKFLPVPVHPCRERVRGFLGFGLLMKPDTAFKMTFFARCCPKSLLSRSFVPAEALLLAAALGEQAVEARVGDVAGEDAGQGQSQADGLHRPHRQRRQQHQAQCGPAQLHARTRAVPRVLTPTADRRYRQTALPVPPAGVAIFVAGGPPLTPAAAIFVRGTALACFGRWGRFITWIR